MAIFQLLPNGIGETSGDQLATTKPMYATGDVWYVNSASGTDAAAPAGKNRAAPLATLSQALTNAANNDIIVLADGHSETLTSVLTISKSVSIVGAGSSSGNPTVKFTINAAAASLFSITAARVELRNIWIEENAQANSAVKISVSGAMFRMVGCYIEANDNDNATCLNLVTGANNAVIEETTFISTSTTIATQPESAMKTPNALTNLELTNVTFSGGSVGWSNHYAYDGDGGAVTYLKATGISLLLGADMRIEGASKGWVNVQNSTGGAGVEWSSTDITQWPNGLGEPEGDILVTCKPLIMSGNAWFVHNATGTDVGGTAGQNRSEPLATLAQAVTNSASGDVIVLMDGHEQTLTATQTISKDLTIAGGGQVGGKPTAKLTMNSSFASMMTISAADAELRNIWFEEDAQASSASKLSVTATRFALRGCYIEADDNANAPFLSVSGAADVLYLDNTTFLSTATAITAVPVQSMSVTSLSLAMLTGVTIDGGQFGWDALIGAAFFSTVSFRASGMSLLRGTDLQFEDSVQGGWLLLPTTTGSCSINCVLELA